MSVVLRLFRINSALSNSPYTINGPESNKGTSSNEINAELKILGINN